MFAGVGLATLLALAAWQAYKNQGPNSGGFSVGLVTASATRDVSDFPRVSVAVLVDFQSDAAAAAISFPPAVRCTMSQDQKTRTRTFTGQVDVGAGAGTSRFSKATVVIAPTDEDDKGIVGDYDVFCELIRDNAVLSRTTKTTVTVPPLLAGGENADLTGTYDVDLAPRTGPCGAQKGSFNVTLTSPGVVRFDGNGNGPYDSPLDASLAFSFDMKESLNDPFYTGIVTGRFSRAGDTVRIDGTVDRSSATVTDPCTFTFTGAKRQ